MGGERTGGGGAAVTIVKLVVQSGPEREGGGRLLLAYDREGRCCWHGEDARLLERMAGRRRAWFIARRADGAGIDLAEEVEEPKP